jgi:hypothetical protein
MIFSLQFSGTFTFILFLCMVSRAINHMVPCSLALFYVELGKHSLGLFRYTFHRIRQWGIPGSATEEHPLGPLPGFDADKEQLRYTWRR